MPLTHHVARTTPLRTTARRTIAGVLAGALVGGAAAVTLVPGAEAAPKGARAYGLTASGDLVSFNVRTPGRLDSVGKIRGIGKQDIVGIDIRPANGKLYGVGSGGSLFTINTNTAKATKVGQLDVKLRGASFGVDVNPAADAMRIVSNSGQNLRHAFTGNVTTADSTLNVPDVDNRVTGIVAAAYTNNDNDDSTGTALYDLNSASDTLALQVPANAGIISSLGPLGKKTSFRAGFDIRTEKRAGKAVANTGYATLGGKTGYALYTVDLTTGRTHQVGEFGRLVVDLAVVS